jgi:hypothetical protein
VDKKKRAVKTKETKGFEKTFGFIPKNKDPVNKNLRLAEESTKEIMKYTIFILFK